VQAKLRLGGIDDPLEREADDVASQVLNGHVSRRISGISPAVQSKAQATEMSSMDAHFETQLQASKRGGRMLDDNSRTFFETRFGRDFTHVRIHDDTEAASLTRQIQARAFTMDNHIYLARDEAKRNAPHQDFLMAHELTHVVQQNGGAGGQENATTAVNIQRIPLGQESAFERYQRGSTLPYREATNMADCLRIMGSDSRAYCEREVLGQATPEAEIEECIRQRGADPGLCDPGRALNWGDFQATAPAGGSYTAMTFANIVPRTLNTRLCAAQVYQSSGTETRGFQAQFDPAQSWVKQGFGNDASQNNRNGCDANIQTCTNDLNNNPGGWWAMNSGANAQCPASVRARGDRATTVAECTTVVGRDCNDRAVAESARLLRHEQGHFDIACVMARKAQDALDRGGNFDRLLPVARQKMRQTQNRYDNQTRHGCRAAQQQTWETSIANNLPTITIP